MIPSSNIPPSMKEIEESIEGEFKDQICKLRYAKASPENLYDVIWASKQDGGIGGFSPIIPAYFIIRREFDLAWRHMMVFLGSWHMADLSTGRKMHILESSAIRKPVDYWASLKMEPMNVVFGIYYPFLRFEGKALTGVYVSRYEKWVNPEVWLREAAQLSSKLQYDASPAARNAKVQGVRDFYLKYDSLPENFTYLEACMPLDRREEAEELLFRLFHILSSPPPSKSKLDMPPVHQTWPLYYFYRAWLDARKATTAKEKRDMGWLAIRWLFELFLRNVDGGEAKHEHDYFHDTIAIAAETDLFGKDQATFLSCFKIIAMTRTVEAYRRLVNDKTPLLKAEELGMLPVSWYVEKWRSGATERRARAKAHMDASIAQVMEMARKQK